MDAAKAAIDASLTRVNLVSIAKRAIGTRLCSGKESA
jgi:hypothetical protein